MNWETIIGYILAIIATVFGGGGLLYLGLTRRQKQADTEKTAADIDKTEAETDSIRINNLTAILDKLQCQYERLEKKVEDLERELQEVRLQLKERQKYIDVLESRLFYIVALAKTYIGQLVNNNIEPDKELPDWADEI